MLWANELHDMSRIIGVALLVQLSAIESIDKQADGTFMRIRATRETA